MLLQVPSNAPVVVKVVDPPTPEVGVADILIQAIGLTGLLVLGSILLGLLLGALFIWFRIMRPANQFNGETSEQTSLRLGPEAGARGSNS